MIVVRQAALCDLPAIGRLYETWRLQQPAYPRLDPDERARFLLAWADQFANPHGEAWVALDGDRVVGFMDGDVKARTFGKPRVYLHGANLWVDPTARHSGAATLLVAACAEWLSSHGLDVLEMTEVAATEGAWGARGWAQTKVATSYWAPTRDLLPFFARRPAVAA